MNKRIRKKILKNAIAKKYHYQIPLTNIEKSILTTFEKKSKESTKRISDIIKKEMGIHECADCKEIGTSFSIGKDNKLYCNKCVQNENIAVKGGIDIGCGYMKISKKIGSL